MSRVKGKAENGTASSSRRPLGSTQPHMAHTVPYTLPQTQRCRHSSVPIPAALSSMQYSKVAIQPVKPSLLHCKPYIGQRLESIHATGCCQKRRNSVAMETRKHKFTLCALNHFHIITWRRKSVLCKRNGCMPVSIWNNRRRISWIMV